MKKVFVLVALICSVCLFSAGSSFAAGTTPIKLSLLPQICVPAVNTVHGLDFGLLGTQSKEVQGVQLSWIYNKVDNKMVGVQSSLIDIAGNVTGVQWGFFNKADSVTGAQVGFVNITGTLNGIQIGLVNMIKKGAPLPFMVIANANF